MKVHAPHVLAGRLALATLGLLILGGCVTLAPGSCEQFEQTRKDTRYDTVYRYSDADTRLAAKSFTTVARAEPLAVRWYTLRINRAQIRPCDHLYLTKDLYLQRNGNTPAVLLEQREFFTAEGKLIATKREDISAQLKVGGFYSASVPLPIPQEAPPGAYRVVTRIITKTAKGVERTLAMTSAEFRVQP